MDLDQRSRVHGALGDVSRLRVVDLLSWGDLTVHDLATDLGIPGNLLAHHLTVLEKAGIIERRVSEGDRRRRYVMLRRLSLDGLISTGSLRQESVLFVCSHNSARSQFAAAQWAARTGQIADSAGSEPAASVHPLAVRVAAERGIDLSTAIPRGYSSMARRTDLLVSVCDRAREGDLPDANRRVHWSIPDPVPIGSLSAFRLAFSEIERRIDDLAGPR